ncbi:hypothetical protein SAICODRAFT_168950 [Saitoella complicata NRRL Y-17804]|nr:uncharacterized protein SAICODRAFT_168950 [Saitoella complicata NRRL Y-17804]ODQ50776.1 hypothetical protein SAICODRAFT_168950 [Saitoella complicata NRRL Y-17804]
MTRLALYGAVSTALATAVVLGAFMSRPNFYAAAVYLSQSNAHLIVLANFALCLTLAITHGLQLLLFGPLRLIERERLYERGWYALTETCLAMTVFREEFDVRFIVCFVCLLIAKAGIWLCEDRVDYMEQMPYGSLPWYFHARMGAALSLLLTTSVTFVHHAFGSTLVHGPNMMIMFAFEFGIVTGQAAVNVAKYTLNILDLRRSDADEEPWEAKSTYVFYLELALDLYKLLLYLAFFLLIVHFYGLPLHILRDLYLTVRSFVTRVRDFLRYRRATRDMNERYPDATPAELEATGDAICMICREEMLLRREGGDPVRDRERAKKLPCGHILHLGCLRSWLERQQSCPTCRRPVFPQNEPRPNAARPPLGGQGGANAFFAGAGNVFAGGFAGGANFVPPPAAGAPQANGPAGPAAQPNGVAYQLPPGLHLPPGWTVLPLGGELRHAVLGGHGVPLPTPTQPADGGAANPHEPPVLIPLNTPAAPGRAASSPQPGPAVPTASQSDGLSRPSPGVSRHHSTSATEPPTTNTPLMSWLRDEIMSLRIEVQHTTQRLASAESRLIAIGSALENAIRTDDGAFVPPASPSPALSVPRSPALLPTLGSFARRRSTAEIAADVREKLQPILKEKMEKVHATMMEQRRRSVTAPIGFEEPVFEEDEDEKPKESVAEAVGSSSQPRSSYVGELREEECAVFEEFGSVAASSPTRETSLARDDHSTSTPSRASSIRSTIGRSVRSRPSSNASASMLQLTPGKGRAVEPSLTLSRVEDTPDDVEGTPSAGDKGKGTADPLPSE